MPNVFFAHATDSRAVATNSQGQRWNGTAWEDHVDGNWSTYLIAPTTLGTSIDRVYSVPADAVRVAVYDGASPLVSAVPVGLVSIGETQPRHNRPAGESFKLRLSSRNDGTHRATMPVRLRPGIVGDIAVSIDMSPLFGELHVKTVGTPTVSTGSITAAAIGPRDDGNERSAMIRLGGTASQHDKVAVTIPVTMETDEVVDATFDINVLAD